VDSSSSGTSPRCPISGPSHEPHYHPPGYLSILPVDQGIEHSAGASFAPNPIYFDPENIVKLAIEGGCNAVASTLGVLGLGVARKYAHKIPFIVKINHNEFLTYPEQVRPDPVRQRSSRPSTWARRRSARRSTSARPNRRARSSGGERRPSAARTSSAWRPCCGATCATTPSRRTKDYHVAADLTGQANHLGVTIEADIIKQKLPRTTAATTRSTSARRQETSVYSDLTTDHPIDLALPGGELLHGPRG
jgi:class I fructose-bisphosphate aldolase